MEKRTSPEIRLTELGLSLPPAPAPAGNYLPLVRVGRLLTTSGTLPLVEGQLVAKGKVGREVTPELAYAAARQCALNLLAVLKAGAGNNGLDGVERLVSVAGFVAADPSYSAIPAVLNGASDLFVAVFGPDGQHARTAVGVAVLPMDAPVEVQVTALLKE